MIFHEIYGSYYNAVADIIKCAQEGGLTESRMSEIINKYAFEESALNTVNKRTGVAAYMQGYDNPDKAYAVDAAYGNTKTLAKGRKFRSEV